MCFDVATPPNRNLADEQFQTTQAMQAAAPDVYAAEAQYRPQYGALDRQIFEQNLLGAPQYGTKGVLDVLENNYAPSMERINASASTAAQARQRVADVTQREGDISDVSQLGKRAVDAIAAANPEQAALMAKMRGTATRGYSDPLQATLARQSGSELAMGARLDPSLAGVVAQSVASGRAARGMAPGNLPPGLVTAMQAEQLRQARQNFALQTSASGLAQNQLSNGQALQTAQIGAATQQDPFLAILGRPSGSTNAGAALGAGQLALANQNVGVDGKPQMFDPLSQYASSLFNTNYNGQAGAINAEATNYAKLYGQAISTSGQIGGAGVRAAG